MNSKRGTSFVTDWSLKQKDSYKENSPINTLTIFWLNEMLSTARGIKRLLLKLFGYFFFYDDKTIDVKGIQEIFSDIAF